MDTSKTVVFMVFHSSAQANIIKGVLEANGVSCFLSNDISPLTPTFFNAEIGLIRLYILEKDVDTARMILTGHPDSSDSETT